MYGSKWPRKHPIKNIISIKDGNEALENHRILEMIVKYGYKNVRGGRYYYNVFYYEFCEVAAMRNPCNHT